MLFIWKKKFVLDKNRISPEEKTKQWFCSTTTGKS